ncbi:MAG: TlpA disulfide reductase family protein [bacterium]
MIGASSRKTLILFIVIGSVLLAIGCAKKDSSSEVTRPVYYSNEILDSARSMIDEGYGLLDSNLVDSAVATFTRINELIPTGLIGNYHIACAYGRSGNTSKGIEHLQKLVDAGYDTPENLKYDTDLESLKSDPLFEQIVQKANANLIAGGEAISKGLPDYDAPSGKFADLDEFDAWYKEQNSNLRRNSMAWTTVEGTLAKIELEAQKLAAYREFKADDSAYDYGLERMRASASIFSMYEPWGAMTDAVESEVTSFLSTSPSDDAKNEALYLAGLAAAMKFAADDDNRVAAYTKSNEFLAKVTEESDFYGPAQALTMINNLRLPNADAESLKSDFKTLVNKYPDDKTIYRLISTQYGPGAVDMLWPIQIDLEDIDGQLIKLADYKGKVLLIDFWATWCGPCRAELPNVVENYKKYHDKGFEIVSISLDYKDRTPLEDYRTWIKEHEMTWRHTYDGEGWDTGIVKKYFVSSIPATFLVGPEGNLIAKGDELRGVLLGEQIQKALGSL